MKLIIGNSDLEFLENIGHLTETKLPVSVMHAAFIKTDLLKAIPCFPDLKKWKSLKFVSKDKNSGSISLIDDWRMDLRSTEGNEEQREVTLIKIRGHSNE